MILLIVLRMPFPMKVNLRPLVAKSCSPLTGRRLSLRPGHCLLEDNKLIPLQNVLMLILSDVLLGFDAGEAFVLEIPSKGYLAGLPMLT